MTTSKSKLALCLVRPLDPQVITSADRQVFAAGLLATVLKLVQQVVHQLRGNMAFPEMFGPIQDVLLQVPCALSTIVFMASPEVERKYALQL